MGLASCRFGTHPTAVWERSRQSVGERYDSVMDDLQMIGRRNMLCGMHVHVELPNPDQRIDIMTRMLPHVPLFIALSASSPFWRSQPTGLKGYRLAAYDELPRTGIPELFKTKAEFDSLYRGAGKGRRSFRIRAISGGRSGPRSKHPTLELRAPDTCTRLEDTIAIAALYRALARRLYYNPWQNWGMSSISRAIIVENKWRAQRYGVNGTFARIEGDGSISVAEMLEQHDRRSAPRCRDTGLPRRKCCIAAASSSTAHPPTVRCAIYDRCAEEPEKGLQAVSEWLADTTLL